MSRDEDDAQARVSRWSRTAGRAKRPDRLVAFPGVAGEKVRLWAPSDDEEQQAEVDARQRLTAGLKLSALDLSLASDTKLFRAEEERQLLYRVMRDPDDATQSYFESADELREALEAPQREALMRELRLWKVERYPELALDDVPAELREGKGLLDWMAEAKSCGAMATWWASFSSDTQYAIMLSLVETAATATPRNSSGT